MIGTSRNILIILFLAAALGTFTHNYYGFESSNELSRLYLAASMAGHGELSIDRVMERWGPVTDKSVRSDKHYSDKSPGASWIALIPCLMLRALSAATGFVFDRDKSLAFVRIFAVILPCLMFLFYLTARLGDFTEDKSIVLPAVAAYAFGTPVWVYSTLLYGHQLTAASLFTAYLLLRGEDKKDPWRDFFTGCLLGLSVALDYPAAWAAVCLVVYKIRRRGPGRVTFWLGLAIPIVAIMAYNHAAFGGPLTTGYSFKAYQRDAVVHASGFLGVSLPSGSVLWGILFSLKRGLFFFSPWLILALPGFIRMARRRDMRADFILCLSVVTGHTLLISGFGDWTAGWSYGPRHLVLMLPFLLPPILVELEAAGRVERLGAAMLASISVINTALATGTFPHVPIQLKNPITDLFVALVQAGDAGPVIGGLGHRAAVTMIIVFTLASITVFGIGLGRKHGEKWVAGIVLASVIAAGLWVNFVSRRPTQGDNDEHFVMSQVFAAVGDDINTIMELEPLTLPFQPIDLRIYASYTLWKIYERKDDVKPALNWRRLYLDLRKKKDFGANESPK